ncbi:MAG TPA: pyridoxamine 5'-phosphate oxidase family protein [Jiangellales bacterium]|nr:pyridoxamine 5'-phosphate oxidase family protein [Jiangellales bacterium]
MSTHRAYRAGHGLTGWARQVLDHPLDAILGTVNADGSPHVVPVGYAFDGRRFVIPTGSATRKVHNVESDPRARVLVPAPVATTGLDDGWVAADGQAHLVQGNEAAELNAAAVSRYLTDEGKRGYAEIIQPLMDVTIVVVPERWQTWDVTGMVDTAAEHGFTPDDLARWYVPR